MTDEQQPQPIDPWDPESLRITDDDVPTEQVLLSIPVRKPKRQDFFRVRPGDDYTLNTIIYVREHGLDKEVYLIARELRAVLGEDGDRVRLFTCMSRRDVLFLWPAKLPEADGAGRAWHTSALEIAEEAKKSWVRMVSDRDAGSYAMHVAKGDLGEPTWPDLSLKDLIRLAFKERYIDTPHHDVIRELNGEL